MPVMITYLVRRNSDIDLGAGHMVNVAQFTTRDQAEICADNQRKTFKSTDIVEMEVFFTYKEFHEKEIYEIKKRALAKLTPEEKRVLGW